MFTDNYLLKPYLLSAFHLLHTERVGQRTLGVLNPPIAGGAGRAPAQISRFPDSLSCRLSPLLSSPRQRSIALFHSVISNLFFFVTSFSLY